MVKLSRSSARQSGIFCDRERQFSPTLQPEMDLAVPVDRRLDSINQGIHSPYGL